MGKSKIEWLADGEGEAGATWNPLRGCSRISAGCTHCYAESMAARFSKPGLAFEGYARMSAAGPRWTGMVRLIQEKLTEPLSWKEPKRVFVCSMSDLFHASVLTSVIDEIFGVMMRCPQHTFLVLTKRSSRLPEYFTGDRIRYLEKHPGIQIGVSAEDQETFDDRHRDLVRVPCRTRFISAEPLLGPIMLPKNANIHWIIVGGESGHGARPMDPAWCRMLLAQARQQGIAYFQKQMGSVWAKAAGQKSGKGGKPAAWPTDLRVREYPKAVVSGDTP